MTASPGAADPIVAAVAADLDEWTGRLTLPEIREFARQAVEAHRRAVLDRRDDGERWAILSTLAEKSPNGVLATEAGALLAALADAEIARRQAEAERDCAWAYQNQRADKGWQSYHEMRAERDRLLAERKADHPANAEEPAPSGDEAG